MWSEVKLSHQKEKSNGNIFADDYHTDTCLFQAGGKANGTIDFYQMHTYSWNGVYNPSAPLKSPVGPFLSFGNVIKIALIKKLYVMLLELKVL